MSLPLTAVSRVPLGAMRIGEVGAGVVRATSDSVVASRASYLGWNVAAISSSCETIAPPAESKSGHASGSPEQNGSATQRLCKGRPMKIKGGLRTA
jgi:hypothetical protein